MEDITDVKCMHRKKVFKDFKIKNLVEYHDLYVQSDTLLLAAFKFWKMCPEIYELDPAHFISKPG